MKKIYWVTLSVVISTSLSFKLYDWYENQNLSESSKVASSSTRLDDETQMNGKASLLAQSQSAKTNPTNSPNQSRPGSPDTQENGKPRANFNQTDTISISDANAREAQKVQSALKSTDPNIRFNTLMQFHNSSDLITMDTFADLIQNDTSEEIRLAALRWVVSSPQASADNLREILERALSDSSEAVRAQARSFLDQVDDYELAMSGQDQTDPQKN